MISNHIHEEEPVMSLDHDRTLWRLCDSSSQVVVSSLFSKKDSWAPGIGCDILLEIQAMN